MTSFGCLSVFFEVVRRVDVILSGLSGENIEIGSKFRHFWLKFVKIQQKSMKNCTFEPQKIQNLHKIYS